MIELIDSKSYSTIYLAPEAILAIIPTGSETEVMLKGGRIVRVAWSIGTSIRVSDALREGHIRE